MSRKSGEIITKSNRDLNQQEIRDSQLSRFAPISELRVIQTAVHNLGEGGDDLGDEHAYAWVNFINRLAENNFGTGRARALGSMSITLVSAQEINKMMVGYYGRKVSRKSDFHDTSKRVRKGLDEFLFEAYNLEATKHDQEIEQLDIDTMLKVDFEFGSAAESSGDRYQDTFNQNRDQEFVSNTAREEVLPLIKTERRAMLKRHRFSEMVYLVPEANALQPYSRNAYGLDLSANEGILEMRLAILRHLKSYEKFDTRTHTDPNWQAHTTIFDLLRHLTVDQTPLVIKKHKHDYPMPSAITFNGPRTNSLGDGIVN